MNARRQIRVMEESNRTHYAHIHKASSGGLKMCVCVCVSATPVAFTFSQITIFSTFFSTRTRTERPEGDVDEDYQERGLLM